MADKSKALGAAAWILEDLDSKVSVGDVCQTSGNEREVNAYRSELQGIHSLLDTLEKICQHYNIKEGKIRVYCDNKGALQTMRWKSRFTKHRKKHADLVRAITAILCRLPLEMEAIHVYGHQDDTIAWEALSRPAQINTMVDREAKDHLLRNQCRVREI